jgi:hypothetical protein
MNLPLVFRSPAQQTTPPVPVPAAPPPATQPSAPASPGVYCRHGIHDGHFPLAGITVGEARRLLGPLLHLDPKAVAVINGKIVPDDHTIGPDVAAINFMKESMVKG